MSQARQIYEFLTASNNQAADTVLLLGLRRAEEPYRTALLEIILDRGRSSAAYELISQWHQFGLPWQKLLTDRVQSLYGGLFQAGRDKNMQIRLNCLDIIRQAQYVPLAELVVSLLRDRANEVSREAGSILLDWARHFKDQNEKNQIRKTKEKVSVHGFPEHDINKLYEFGWHPQASLRAWGWGGFGIKIAGQGLLGLQNSAIACSADRTDAATHYENNDERQLFISALERAVRDYPVHQKSQALKAAMCIVGTQVKSFWKERLGPYSVVGRAVRDILLDSPTTEVAGFCLSALGHPTLRAAAIRAVTHCQRSEFLVALAEEFLAHGNESTKQGLGLIKQQRCLDEQQLPPGELSPTKQLAMVTLVSSLGIPRHRQVDYLAGVIKDGAEDAALEAVKILGLWEDKLVLKHLVTALDSRHEWVVLAAVKVLARKKHPRLPQFMVRLLSNEHKHVRVLARSYLQKTAFESYWNNFERLTRTQRIDAGKAVFKLDPAAGRRWRARTQHISSHQRLRAVQIARLLEQVDEFGPALQKLAGDPDRKVRSCAVAGLGELSTRSGILEACLRSALKDADSRVRANAIEALEHRQVRSAVKDFEHFTRDANNRVRANAIKALLSWKVDSARQAIQQMITDPRPRHRRSARWVAQQMSKQHTEGLDPEIYADEKSALSEKTDDRVVVSV
jgi:HEAT repeat protein